MPPSLPRISLRSLTGVAVLVFASHFYTSQSPSQTDAIADHVPTREEAERAVRAEEAAKRTIAQSRPAKHPKSPLEAARALVEEIENSPGYSDQMCLLPWIVPREFSPYTFPRFTYQLSADQFGQLRAKRDDVVQAIRDGVLRWMVKSKSGSKLGINEETHAINAHRLVMLIDLNGVEALDALCDVAASAQFDEFTVARRDQSSRPRTGNADDRTAREGELAELLSTITAILRQEGYQPLLESDLEAAYCKKLRAQDNFIAEGGYEAWCRVNRSGPASQPAAVVWPARYLVDDRCKALTTFWPQCWFPMTVERRDQIVQWSRDYLRTTPPEKRKGAKGMSPWPITR